MSGPTEALDRLLELAVLLGEDLDGDLAAAGLTRARVHALWVIGERGPTTQRALADALRVTPRNVTGLVDGLAETGFVRRDPHPTDRRALQVTLTAGGQAVVTRMAAGRAELAGQLFGAFPATRLEGLVDGLDDVLVTLRELVGGPRR